MTPEWKPIKWERTTVDEDEIERQRQRALWKRLEHVSDADQDDEDDDEAADDNEDKF